MYCYISVDVSLHQKHLERHAFNTINLLSHITQPQQHSHHQQQQQQQQQPLDHTTITLLQQLQSQLTTNSTTHWHTLLYHLITKYHDGYRIDDFTAETIEPTALFYPYQWLKDVGFWGKRGANPDWKQTNCQYPPHSPYNTH